MARIIKTTLNTANIPLLDQQLKTALPAKCYGVNADATGLYVVLDDSATNADETTALSVATAHDPQVDTAEQAAEKVGKVNVAALLSAADTAIADLTAKRATAVATPNIANVGALVLSITDTLIAVVKCLKYILVNYN
jgi:hypothetical protein